MSEMHGSIREAWTHVRDVETGTVLPVVLPDRAEGENL